MRLQAFELRLDLLIAFGQLRHNEIESRQGLLEREQVLHAPVAFEALGDFVMAGTREFVETTSKRLNRKGKELKTN